VCVVFSSVSPSTTSFWSLSLRFVSSNNPGFAQVISVFVTFDSLHPSLLHTYPTSASLIHHSQHTHHTPHTTQLYTHTHTLNMISFRHTILAIIALLPLTQAFTVYTPATLTECLPAAISWTGATSPVYVSILKGGNTVDPALEQLGEVPSGSMVTWRVDLMAGTKV
jgi:hypothetical protein